MATPQPQPFATAAGVAPPAPAGDGESPGAVPPPRIRVHVNTTASDEFARAEAEAREEGGARAHARVLRLSGEEAANFDVAALVARMTLHNPDARVSFGGNGVDRAFGQRVLKTISDDSDIEMFRMLRTSRALSRDVQVRLTIEQLTNSGAGVAARVDCGFPSLDGGSDQHREDAIVHQTDARWFVQNEKLVGTNMDHLCTLSERAAAAAAADAKLDAQIAAGTGERTMDDAALAYPRLLTRDAPAPGETKAVSAQGDLSQPLVFKPKHRLRVVVEGLRGTDGATHASRVFTGKELADAMLREFKGRKAHLAKLRGHLDAGLQVDVSLGAILTGNSFSLERTADQDVRAGEVADLSFHAAWTSANRGVRALVLTGVTGKLLLRRPAAAAAADDGDVCALCLEPIAGAPWECVQCKKGQHASCVQEWRDHCARNGLAATCPCCRVAV